MISFFVNRCNQIKMYRIDKFSIRFFVFSKKKKTFICIVSIRINFMMKMYFSKMKWVFRKWKCIWYFMFEQIVTRKIWHFLSKSFDIENYRIIRKCSLKQRLLLHNDILQSLHSYTILEIRRRRWLRIKLLSKIFCNDFVTRFVLTIVHWILLHIIQYLSLFSSFCIISCFNTKTLLTNSIRKSDLIFDFVSLDWINRSKCSNKSIMKSCLKILWVSLFFNSTYDRFSIILTIL